MKIVIINPTYNEKQNIPILAKRIDKVRQKLANKRIELMQLVVDDNSPDGTSEEVRRLQEEYSFMYLINGNKKGLGDAYIRGMKYAIKKLKADFVVEMDADLQHSPEDLPQMIKQMSDRYDLIIGSRYVRGGTYPKEWGRFRVLNSTIANILARYIAGFYRVKDCTSGYRLIRIKGVLDKVDFENLHANGYSFQLMLLAALIKLKARSFEYPIHFKERKYGDSKVGMNKTYFRDILEFFKNAIYIRYINSQTIIRFLLVGGFGTIVNLFIYKLMLDVSHNLSFNELIAGEVSTLFNFTLNYNWTFKSPGKPMLQALVVYNLSSAISTATVWVCAIVFGNKPILIYPLIGIVLGTIWNYTISSKLIWGSSDALKSFTLNKS